MSNEDEDGLFRRFLNDLEQTVGGFLIHLLRKIEYYTLI